MKHIRLISIITALALVFTFVVCVSADFGDYGGDYDYGGSYDSGSYDSGSYDYGGYDSYDNNDYGNNDTYYYGGTTDSGNSNGGNSGGGSAVSVIVVFVIIALIVVILMKRKGSGSNSGIRNNTPVVGAGATATDPSTLNPVGAYLNVDPAFSEAEFKEKISNMYVKFQNSWQAKNMDDLRPYLTDAMFAQCDRQLDNLRTNGQTNRIERISVLDVTLSGWKQESGNDVMIARLKTRIVDYVVDDNTGNIIRGSNTAEKFMEYEWSLVRTSGTVTQQGSGTKAQVCPNCGAHVDINRTAKCEYCGSILTTDTFDWAVSGIKGLSQRTMG